MTLEGLIHNRDFLSGLCGLAAFVVVALVWLAMIESDPLPARLKSVLNRKSELREVERRKLSRRAGLNRAGDEAGAVKLKLARGKKLDELGSKLARRVSFARYDTRLSVSTRPVKGFGFLLLCSLRVAGPNRCRFAIVLARIFGMKRAGYFHQEQEPEARTRLRYSKAMPDAFDLLVIRAEAGSASMRRSTALAAKSVRAALNLPRKSALPRSS